MADKTQIEAELREWLARDIFDASVELDRETDLLAAGFDSMSLVRLLLFVEEQYGTEIPEAEITEEVLSNIRTLAEFIDSILAGAP